MANRVTSAEVIAILGDDNSDLTDVSAFIAMATLLTDKCSAAGLAAADCKEVERWLSAHLVATGARRLVKSSAVGPISESFDSKIDLGLNGTSYGQQAIALDTTSTLASLSGKVVFMDIINP